MVNLRSTGWLLLAIFVMLPVQATDPDESKIPEDLKRAYRAFATAMTEGKADKAIEFYARDAVVLVDSDHVYRGRSAILEGFLHVYLQTPTGNNVSGTEIEVDRMVAGGGAVTFAGRYSSSAEISGIYSNTWQRQDEGDWKLAASVMTFEATGSMDPSSEKGFNCTQVLGFSQSLEWYGGLSLADYKTGEGPPKSPSLEAGAFMPAWQGRFYLGAAVEKWTDPEFPGWSGSQPMAYETATHCAREEVDRVVFNVSGAARSPDEWASAVESVAELIREKFRAARQIVMQPVVGAPEGKCPEVRAARNHPYIAEGIRRVAQRGMVNAGPKPKVASCGQFHDELGHLTKDGARHVQKALKAYYRGTSVVPEASARRADEYLSDALARETDTKLH